MEFEFGVVESLDKVPEQFRPLYVAGSDGKFALGETFKGVAEAVTGLNKALKSERGRKMVDLSALADFGDTPEKIKEAFTSKIKDLEDQLAAGSKVNVEKIRQEFATAHASEVTKHKNRAEALQSQLYGLLVDNQAVSVLAEAKGDTELALPFVRQQVKVVEEEGKASVHVIDKDGNRRYSTVTGLPMTIKELVVEMKGNARYARLFDSEALSGGGMSPGGGKPPIKPPAGAPRSALDKIKAGLDKGGLRKEKR